MGDSFNFLRNPKWQIVFAILGGLLIYIGLTYWLGGAWENFWSIMIDLVLFYGGIVFWMFFFAQFTLPVKETLNRRLAFERLWSYLFGQHGAAIFIENGEIRKHVGELDTDLPGIAVLDTASAAVLRTDVEYTRAVGPGVIFNEYNANNGLLEQIRDGGTVDLHGQSQFFGPQDENPFEERSEDGISATSSERKKRRWQTRGLTRNGIEIVPNVLVTFRLDSTPGDGHTQFGYNEAAVFKALTSGGIDPDVGVDNLHRNVTWNELPCYLAVDVWRELIAMFTLDELFQDLPADFMAPGSTDKTRQGPRKPMTGLDFINAYLRQRLTQPEVDLLDNFGHITGNKVPSQEFRQLKDRGIKVSFAFVVNLRFQESVEEELISRWKLTWEQKALDEKFKIEKEVNDSKVHGQTKAMRDYSREVSLSLSRLSPGIAHDSTKILTRLAEGSLSVIVRKPALNHVMNDEKLILLDLINWLQKRP